MFGLLHSLVPKLDILQALTHSRVGVSIMVLLLITTRVVIIKLDTVLL